MTNALDKPEIRFKPVGDGAWLIEFGQRIDPAINAQVRAWASQLMTQRALLPGLIETVAAFASMTLFFDPLVTTHDAIRTAIAQLDDPPKAEDGTTRRWKLPCCYDDSLAWDLADAAAELGVTKQSLVDQHAASVFFAYALGFMPGFAYMGGLPDKLALPRLASPRSKVPASSVAVTGTMTGVYPFSSPGGWRILGRTPLTMFDAQRSPAAIIEPGDEVQFTPISRAEFDALRANPPLIESLL